MYEQGTLRGMGGRAANPKPPRRRGRPRQAIFRAPPPILHQDRLFQPPEYVEYLRIKKELGL